jgi:hypothetical protein
MVRFSDLPMQTKLVLHKLIAKKKSSWQFAFYLR